MLQRIQQLPIIVANQISAGEVIERPASVVKECLENSVDALSTRIELRLRQGGKSFIQITDNGSGIHPDDLALALSRHATSKITKAEDLVGIQSLGFRGEALASIAAISELTLISNAGEQAWQISVSGEDQQASIRQAAHPQGSTIIVSDLFFNTPVRRKFLASDRTEYQHIEAVFKRMALSHFEIAFRLFKEDEEIFNLPAALSEIAKQKRVEKLCGKGFLNESIVIDQQAEGLRLSGWLSKAEFSHPHSDLQYFFINGRMVRDKVINHALRVGMQELLPEGRYPAYVLYLHCDPASVDVNVHPTKHEVRFQQSRLIHDFISNAVKKNLCPVELSLVEEQQELYFHPASFQVAENAAEYSCENVSDLEGKEQSNLGVPLMQLKLRYLLVENSQGLMILDLCKAKEFLYLQLLQSDQLLLAQALLLPITLNLSQNEIQALKNLPLENWGIIGQQISQQQFLVKALPEILKACDLESLFVELAKSKEPIKCLAKRAAEILLPLSKLAMQTLLQQLAAYANFPESCYQQIQL